MSVPTLFLGELAILNDFLFAGGHLFKHLPKFRTEALYKLALETISTSYIAVKIYGSGVYTRCSFLKVLFGLDQIFQGRHIKFNE